jgi:hypothetical protein
MRVHARNIGIGAAPTGAICLTATGQPCSTASDPVLILPQVPGATNPNNPLTPPLPSGYDNTLPTGVIPGNEIGQTNSNLAADNPSLCAQQGGTWDATKTQCDMCPQTGFAALFAPQTWDPATGLCSTDWKPAIIAGSIGTALILFLFATKR